MNDYQHKVRLLISAIFVLASLIILIDYLFPGRTINDTIISLKKERQQYYNAAGNHHYTYQVITSEHQFWIEAEHAAIAEGNVKIEYAISRIFNEVNWYKLHSSEKRATYFLRTLSGLVIPLLTIVTILAAAYFKKNISTLIFVFQVMLIADLIFLMR